MKKQLHTLHCILFSLLIFSQTNFAQQGWIWKKGSNQTTQLGTYGTMGTAAAANNPGTREGASYWKDANGDFWMFGGEGSDNINNLGHLNDLWKYNVTTNQWTWVKGDNLIAQIGVYGTQGIAAATNKPGSRSQAVTWLDASGNVYLFGGLGYGSVSGLGFINDLWKYNPTNNQWTWLNGSNTIYATGNYGTILTASATNVPGARYAASGWTDASGNLWLYGGIGNSTSSVTAGYLNDLWKYDIATNEWTWMKGSNVVNTNGIYGQQTVSTTTDNPGGRRSAMTWKDTGGNFWLFGGEGYDATSTSTTNLADLWKYSTGTNEWTWMKGSQAGNQGGTYINPGLSTSTVVPGSRYGGVTWTDGVGNLWLGFGNGVGTNTATTGKLNDMWLYTTTNNQWTWVYGGGGMDFAGNYGTLNVYNSSNLPGSRRLSGGWTDNNDNLWLFGGFGQATTGAAARLGDLWKFNNCYLSPITLSISTSNTFICAKETVTISVSGATNYTWSTGSTVSSIFVSIPSTSVFVASTNNSVGCIYSATFTQNIDPCTTLIEKDATGIVSIYPNPAVTELNIKHEYPGSIDLFNQLGQPVLSKALTEQGHTKLELNLPAGVYYYTVNQVGNKNSKGKLLITN